MSKINILTLLANERQIVSFSEGRRLITGHNVMIRRLNESGRLEEPEQIASFIDPIDVHEGDVLLIGSKRTIVITQNVIDETQNAN